MSGVRVAVYVAVHVVFRSDRALARCVSACFRQLAQVLSVSVSVTINWLVIRILRNKIVGRAHRPGWRLLLFPERFGAAVLASSSSPLKLKIPAVWSCQLAQGQGFYSLVWPGNGA